MTKTCVLAAKNFNRTFVIATTFLFGFNFLFGQSASKQDSLVFVVEKMPDDSLKVKAFRDLGARFSKSSPEKAEDCFNRAVSLGKRIDEHVFTSGSLAQLAILYNNTGELTKSDNSLREAKSMVEKYPSNRSWGNYYQAEGLIYEKKSQHKLAVESLKKCLAYLKKLNNPMGVAGAYLNIGNNYLYLEQYKSSIENYFSALNIFEEIQNEQGISYCYNALAGVYRDMKQYKDAEKYARKSLELKKKQGDKKGIANSYSMLSEIQLGTKDYKNALLNADLALRNFQELNQLFDVININRIKGRIYADKKDLTNARIFYDKAISGAKNLNNINLENDLKSEKNEKLQPDEFHSEIQNSLENINQELTRARAESDTLTLINKLKELSQYYTNNKDYQKAFELREEYYKLKEITAGPEVLKELKVLESQYELEKKENAIKLLEKDKEITNERIEKQKIGLYALGSLILLIASIAYLFIYRLRLNNKIKRHTEIERMRQEIASDLHDDIGSSLSSIQIISSLMERKGDMGKVKEDAEKISKLSAKVAQGMREIVWSLNPANDTLEAVVSQMRKMAFEMLDTAGIAFSFDVQLKNPEKKLLPQFRKDLMMIYREAVNNARKYSGSAKVHIYLSDKNSVLNLSIKDFGHGFDPQQVEKGNGINNMVRRAEKMGGKFDLKTEKDAGTEINLKIPLS